MKKILLYSMLALVQVLWLPVLAQKSPAGDSSRFRFVINKGEFFPSSAPGQVTELSLSGYFCKGVSAPGQLSPSSSANSITLTGLAQVNPYSKQLQSKVVASMDLPEINSPTGLYLSVIVDGRPLSMQLPYVNQTDSWPTGFTYTYNLTVEGNSLVISGVTCLPSNNGEERMK